MENCLTYLGSSFCPNGLDNPHSLPHVCEGTGRKSYIPESGRFRVGEWNTVPFLLKAFLDGPGALQVEGWRWDKVKADMQTVLAQFVDYMRRVQNSRHRLKELLP